MIDAMCVGAHPDDIEIGMGGTVAKMTAEGRQVVLVDLTDGEPTPHGSKEIRAGEAERAAAILGVKTRRTLSLPNRCLRDTPEARRVLAEVIREFRPRILFVPHGEDAHPDHISASAICEAARFEAKYTKTDMEGEPHYTPRMYHYFATHLRVSPRPSFVVDVAGTIEAKMSSLAAYESQFVINEANRHVLDFIAGQAAYFGSLIGVSHGEPFASREQLGVSSVADLL